MRIAKLRTLVAAAGAAALLGGAVPSAALEAVRIEHTPVLPGLPGQTR